MGQNNIGKTINTDLSRSLKTLFQREIAPEASLSAIILGRLGLQSTPLTPEDPLDELLEKLKSSDWMVRVAAAQVLGQTKNEEVIGSLIGALEDHEDAVRAAAVRSLGAFGKAAPVKSLVMALEDSSWEVRADAIEALGKLEEHAPITVFINALEDEDESVRLATVQACRHLGKRAPTEALLHALETEDMCSVREAIALLLLELGEQEQLLALLAEKVGDPAFFPLVKLILLRSCSQRIPGSAEEGLAVLDEEAGQVLDDLCVQYSLPPSEQLEISKEASQAGSTSRLELSPSERSDSTILAPKPWQGLPSVSQPIAYSSLPNEQPPVSAGLPLAGRTLRLEPTSSSVFSGYRSSQPAASQIEPTQVSENAAAQTERSVLRPEQSFSESSSSMHLSPKPRIEYSQTIPSLPAQVPFSPSVSYQIARKEDPKQSSPTYENVLPARIKGANRIGERIGTYKLVSIIGQGSSSIVYLGKHVFLEKTVAVKVLPLSKSVNTSLYSQEAKMLARVQHPNIASLLDFGIEKGYAYFVMDYIPRGNLRKQYPRGTRPELAQVVNHVNQIASALEYLHKHEIIHRDVKPENLLLDNSGNVLLCDFGIAMALSDETTHPSNQIVGTPYYMAPEQFQGKAVKASDQYSLAILVWEWLTGCIPFEGTMIMDVAHQHFSKEPPTFHGTEVGIPHAVELVLRKGLRKDPSRRYSSVKAFAEALEVASKEEYTLWLKPAVSWQRSLNDSRVRPQRLDTSPSLPEHPEQKLSEQERMLWNMRWLFAVVLSFAFLISGILSILAFLLTENLFTLGVIPILLVVFRPVIAHLLPQEEKPRQLDVSKGERNVQEKRIRQILIDPTTSLLRRRNNQTSQTPQTDMPNPAKHGKSTW
jgi:tRNA A-37 threonylcarbamoyl transferase component Bud32